MHTTENYLRDIMHLLLESARQAKARRDSSGNSGDPQQAAFEDGRAVAYYEVVSTMLEQLNAFRIPRSSIGVPETFDPDRDLL